MRWPPPAFERTEVTEMVSMASSPGDPVPLLVSLKAVDPQQISLLWHGRSSSPREICARCSPIRPSSSPKTC